MQSKKMKKGNARNYDKIKENRQLEVLIEAYKFGQKAKKCVDMRRYFTKREAYQKYRRN